MNSSIDFFEQNLLRVAYKETVLANGRYTPPQDSLSISTFIFGLCIIYAIARKIPGDFDHQMIFTHSNR